MKKIYAFLFTLLLASGAAAQNPTAYFMEGSTLRSQFNPAFAPLRGYVNIPAIGGVNINVGGNIAEAISSGRRAVRVMSGLDPVA